MKSKLFVRPNLKLFALGALLIALVHDFALNGPTDASGLTYTPGLSKISEEELQKYIRVAENKADPEMRCSICAKRSGARRRRIEASLNRP